MAIDADGSTTPSVYDSTTQPQTSLRFADHDRTSVNAEKVPYFVLPMYDDPQRVKPGKPFEGSRDEFVKDFGLRLGNLGVVVYRNKMTGAIFRR